MSGDDGLREGMAASLRGSQFPCEITGDRSRVKAEVIADAVLALPEVAALRAKAAAADRVRELADWFDASPNMNSNRFTADRIRRALDGDGS